ncbi:MAG: 3-hydroxyacyl-CoA dehydrogenase NAD-binding domain-containing protein [Halobacteriota archaeon]
MAETGSRPSAPSNVGVVGAGVMGRDIAGLFAAAGSAVTLVDVDESALVDARRALGGRIPAELEAAGLGGEGDLGSAVSFAEDVSGLAEASIVVEAVPDRLPLKRAVVDDLEAVLTADALLATNTSSLTAADLAVDASHPERIVLFHFANPAIPRELVEIAGDAARAPALRRAERAARAIGKRPIRLARERRGNGLSRLSAAIKCAASWELTRTSAAEIDHAARAIGFDRGPIELIDRIGIDVHLATVDNLADEHGDRFDPPPGVRERLERLESAGHLGRKAGRGLLEWREGEPVYPAVEGDYDVTPVLAALVNEAHRLVHDGIADADTVDEILRRGSGGSVGPFDLEAMLGRESVTETLAGRYDATGAGVFAPAVDG